LKLTSQLISNKFYKLTRRDLTNLFQPFSRLTMSSSGKVSVNNDMVTV